MAILKKKWFVLLAMLIILISFESLVVQIPLSKRVLAIGVGLDLEGEDILLSAQMIIPNKNKGSQDTQYHIFSAKGTTVQEAVSNMQTKIGATPSFAHALVVIVGSNFVGEKLFEAFKTFVGSTIISDNALVGFCPEGTAKEILETKMAVSSVVPYNMQIALLADERPIGQTVSKVKDYFKNYYKVGGCSYFPILEKNEMTQQAAAGGQEPSAPKEEEKTYLMSYDTTLVCDRNYKKIELDKNQTRGLTLVKQSLKDGNFIVTDSIGESVSYSIERSKAKVKVTEERVVFEVSIIIENVQISSIARSKSTKLSDNEKKQIIEQISDSILSCFNFGKINDMDIYNVGEMLYSKYGKKWLEKNSHSLDYLNKIEPSVNVKIKVK